MNRFKLKSVIGQGWQPYGHSPSFLPPGNESMLHAFKTGSRPYRTIHFPGMHRQEL